jgi:hypothetical protein
MSTTVAPSANRVRNGLLQAVEQIEAALQQVRAQQAVIDQQAAELGELTVEVAQLRRERDDYLQAVYALTRNERLPFTDEDRRRQEESGTSLAAFVETLAPSKG